MLTCARLIGFEDLGDNDFTAKALEFRLQHSGMFPVSIQCRPERAQLNQACSRLVR